MDSNIVWAVLLGSCALYEAYGIAANEGATLSDRLRVWFRTSTRSGKIVFTCTWLGLTVWFIPHIILG
jgi:hypothetical protein